MDHEDGDGDSDGDGAGLSGPPESPVQRTRKLRPQLFSALLRLCGAVLVGGPEHPRRVPGVSGLAGVSAPWTGISGPPDDPAHRSLRSLIPETPAWTGYNG